MLRYLVTLLCLAYSCAMAQTTMSHEETTVRTAYAKFAYAVEQGLVGHMALEAENPLMAKHDPDAGKSTEQRLAEGQVRFGLSDFSVGNFSDITDRKVLDLVSAPSGETLETSNNQYSYAASGKHTEWHFLSARWMDAGPLGSEITNMTVAQLYKLQADRGERSPGELWQHYASYTVTVSYMGRTRGPYKAMFLFGRDAHGNEMVQPQDTTISVTGLAYALHENWYPESFTASQLRKQPLVTRWLNERQRNTSCGQHEICCDLTALACGPSHADVAGELARPLPGEEIKQ